MKINKFIWVLILPVLLFSCKGNDDGSDAAFKYSVNDSINSKHDAVVYTLPSPLQISTLIKVMNIKYSDAIVAPTKKVKSYNGTSMQKALFLGVLLVDLGYITVFDQYNLNNNYLINIERLTSELGFKEPATKKSFERYENSIHKKDSLHKITFSYIKDIEENFHNQKDIRLPLIIVSGMLIEGLYILTDTYENQFSKNLMGKVIRNNFNSMLLQNNIYLNNIEELLQPYNKENEISQLLSTLLALKQKLTLLNISYIQDSNTGKLKQIFFDSDHLKPLCNKLGEIREDVIKGKI